MTCLRTPDSRRKILPKTRNYAFSTQRDVIFPVSSVVTLLSHLTIKPLPPARPLILLIRQTTAIQEFTQFADSDEVWQGNCDYH
jgi:hypothetical protein